MQIPQQNYHTYHQTNQVNFTSYLAGILYIVKLYSNTVYQKTMNSLTAVKYVTCHQSHTCRICRYANSAAIIKSPSVIDCDKFHTSM